MENQVRETSTKLNKENWIREASRKLNKETEFYPTSLSW